MTGPLCADDFHRRLTTLIPAAGSSFALAVSGGPDSMALASLCSTWSLTGGGAAEIPVLVVDHGLRPESARESQTVVSRLSALPGLDPHLLKLNLDRPASGVMEKARAGRYALMAQYCKEHGIGYLILAHHLDDQAETVLMRLAKGSGLDGLCGMRAIQRYDERLTLVRPFLDVPKARLVATCDSLKLSYVLDPSNRNEAYMRPRLRSLLRDLEAEGLSASRLGVTARRLGRARAALEDISDRTFAQSLRFTDAAQVRLDCAVLAAWPEEIRLRVILKGLSELEPGFSSPDIRMDKLERLVDALFSEPGFRRRSLGGFLFSCNRGFIVLKREERAPASSPEL